MFEFLRNWFTTPREPRARALETSGSWTLDSPVDPIVDVTLRRSRALDERNGQIPEEMAAVFTSTALSQAGFGYRIRFGFDPVDSPDEVAHCSGESHDWYETVVADWDEAARDANLLLVDADGGGCGQGWPPRVGTVPGRHLDERREYESEGSDRFHSTVQSILHELGHCLGSHHDHDPENPDDQHPGMGWNDHDDRVYRYTPTAFGNDLVNRCGEQVPKREYDTGVRVHEFHDCAVELFETELRDRQD
jgi:hypothetical protein